MRSQLSVLAATFVLAAASGCSNDGDDSSAAGSTAAAADTTAPATATSPTTTESSVRPVPPADQTRWAKQVDAACEPWQEQIDGLVPPANASELERWLGELLPLVRKQVSAVKAVKPPAKQSEAEKAALFVKNLTKLERGLTQYLAAIKANDMAAIERALVDANSAGAASRNYALVARHHPVWRIFERLGTQEKTVGGDVVKLLSIGRVAH